MSKEIVQVLTDHVKSSNDFPDAPKFLAILEDVRSNLSNEQNSNDVKIVRCINLEGKHNIYPTQIHIEIMYRT